MVVLCPNCGREIFSDPDYCVLCGWKREDSSPPRRPADARYSSPPPAQAPVRRDYDQRMRGQPPNQYEQRPTNRPRYDDRRQPPVNMRGYDDRYRDRPPERRGAMPPQMRDSRQFYDDRKRPPPQQQRPPPRTFRPGYEPDMRRPPPQDARGQDFGRRDVNTCPNCGREIFTDPDNCVLCGWSREAEQRRAQPPPIRRPTYEQPPPRGDYREPRYPEERPTRTREIPYRDERDLDYRRERISRGPPKDWEKRVNRRLGVEEPKPREEKRFWYRSKEESPEKDRFVCENCGNPSLQFFADGLGRCPGCGERFRYSPRPVSPRSKQKHKQFVCSKCDSKNLQFFLDGTGTCPHCKREFKWKK